MTTVYAPRSSSSGSVASVLLTLIIVLLLVVGAMWYLGQHHGRLARRDTHFGTVSSKVDRAVDKLVSKRTLDTAGAKLEKAGSAASSALAKMGVAASSAVSETSADIKAASDRQKEQNAQHDETSR